MTVNYSFDLEDDDFFISTFQSISEKDLMNEDPVEDIIDTIKGTKSSIKLNEDICSSSTLQITSEVDSKGSTEKLLNSTLNDHCQSSTENNLRLLNCPNISICDKVPVQDVSLCRNSAVNSRFLPGITPKAKKRKFPGPAGYFTQKDNDAIQSCESNPVPPALIENEVEMQNITSSQFSAEDLLLPSWQNLQAEVSARHKLLSTAQFYSVRRVLCEASKKKLPKHIVVPVLCILIKTINFEDSTVMFIDDTGEIHGKIEKEVFDTHKESLQDGSALILKKITFLCNFLLLQNKNIVSIYLQDGSARHIQDLNSVLDEGTPLKPMSCECPHTPKLNASLKTCNINSPVPASKDSNARQSFSAASGSKHSSIISAASGSGHSSIISAASGSGHSSIISAASGSGHSANTSHISSKCINANQPKDSSKEKTIPKSKFSFQSIVAKSKSNSFLTSTPQSTPHNQSLKSVQADANSSGIDLVFDLFPSPAESRLVSNVSKVQDALNVKNQPQHAAETEGAFGSGDFLCEDSEMDEFDELLGSIDEKSFLES